MKKCFESIYKFSYRSIRFISLMLAVLLALSAFFTTCYVTDMESQVVLTRRDFLPVSLLEILGFFIFLFMFLHFFPGRGKKRITVLLTTVLAWCFTCGLAFIIWGKTVPAADAMTIFHMAEELAKDNVNVLIGPNSYITFYPQQIGLIAFFEIIIRLWNLLAIARRAYPIIQFIYVVLACLTVFYQYKTVHLLFESRRVDCIYLLLAAANVPLIMYTSFVYGEIPSFSALSIGIYYLLRFLKTSRSYLSAIISILTLTLSVLFRKNSLILIIAVLIVVLLQSMHERSRFLLIYTFVCAACALTIQPLTQALYEHRCDNSISSGVPAISYFAMGMQESSRGNGWYNGFNFNTYQATGLDKEQTAQICKAEIAERLEYFRSHPGYTLNFYKNKFLSQWADGSYACRQAVYASGDGRTQLVQSFFTGDNARILVEHCNAYQNIIYLGALSFCIAMIRKKEYCLPLYLGFIGVLGGFLFHIIWEANSRYILLYSLLLLPYAAFGVDKITSKVTFFHKKVVH